MKICERLSLGNYLDRLTILEVRWGSLMLHRFRGSDPDLCLHDHPWWYASFLLWGSYTEETPLGSVCRRWGSLAFRRATHEHRVVIAPGTTAWTLVLTGPASQAWGFFTLKGWMPWRQFEQAGRPASWCAGGPT